MVREGDLIFLKIKFFQGGRSRLPPRSVLDGAHRHQDPLPPKSVLSSGSLFYFVLVGSGTCLSLWGPLRASGTLPSGRPSRQARRCHAGGVTEGVFVGRIEGSRKNRLGVLQTPKRFLTE